MNPQDIRLDKADRILTVTLHRPDKLNAFTRAMRDELIAAFRRADEDDEVRVVIVTGAGRAFCAGADLSAGRATFDYAKREGLSADTHRDGGGRVTLRIFECVKPVIGAINGPAVGIGVTMQLPMDIRIASEAARFGFVFARRGIVPEACSSWFLPRLVGISQAMEWCATGRVFDAAEAKARGLVRSLHNPEELLAEATALAREIAENTAPVSVALARRMLLDMMGEPHPMAAHRLESALMEARGKSGDAREGVTSFLEKRAACFPDKVSRNMPDWLLSKAPKF